MSETTIQKDMRSFRCHKCHVLFEDRECETVFQENTFKVLVEGKKVEPCPNCKGTVFDWVPEEYVAELRAFRLKPDNSMRKMVSCTCKKCDKWFYTEDKDVSCPHCSSLDYTVNERFTKGV